MKQQHADYQMVPYPKARRFMAAARRSVQRTPRMHGLFEVDVSRARAHLRDHKAKTGEALSFTAFIIACVAKAVNEHKSVQASRRGRKHLILFEDVDVSTYIERDVAGQKQIMPYIIRAANRKTFREIHHDIIDGAPAARFTQRLKDLIESGYGLPDSTVESEQARAEAASMKSER